MRDVLHRFARDEAGATAVEYTLICALIGLVMVSSLHGVAQGFNDTFQTLSQALIR